MSQGSDKRDKRFHSEWLKGFASWRRTYPNCDVDLVREVGRQNPVGPQQGAPVSQKGVAHSLQKEGDVHYACHAFDLLVLCEVEHQLRVVEMTEEGDTARAQTTVADGWMSGKGGGGTAVSAVRREELGTGKNGNVCAVSFVDAITRRGGEGFAHTQRERDECVR